MIYQCRSALPRISLTHKNTGYMRCHYYRNVKKGKGQPQLIRDTIDMARSTEIIFKFILPSIFMQR